MTDEQGMESQSDETVSGEPRTGVGQEISSTVAKLGAGEKLAVLGAAGVLVVWVVFGLLMDEYGIGSTAFVLSVIVTGSAYLHHNRGSEQWAIPYRTVVTFAGALLGAVGAFWLLVELRNDILGTDAGTVIGALVFYVSAIASGIGAYQLSSKG